MRAMLAGSGIAVLNVCTVPPNLSSASPPGEPPVSVMIVRLVNPYGLTNVRGVSVVPVSPEGWGSEAGWPVAV